MIKRLIFTTLVIAAASATAPAANAQGFSNACGGTTFFTCLNLAIASSNSGLTQTFTITNVSNGLLANNPNSFFGLLGLGSSGTAPTSMGSTAATFTTACTNATTGCGSTSPSYANGFSGAGFTASTFFGLDAHSPAPTNGLHDGQSVSFYLNFTNSAAATSFLNGLQLAVHDQDGLTEACGSNKVVFNANGQPTTASSSPSSAATCTGRVNTTPEPTSIALLGTGLVGLFPVFRRRR